MARGKAKSEYEKLVDQGMLHTRKRDLDLTEEQKAERRRAASRLAMEARRRASAVLITQHREDYNALYENERKALADDPRYKTAS